MPASDRRYRPPLGFPEGDRQRGRWPGLIFAIALHALAVFLLLIPAAAAVRDVADPHMWGARGARRGGGGGGNPAERLRYVETRPAAAVPRPAVRQRVERKPVPPPIIPPPRPIRAPVPPAPSPPLLAPSGAATAPGTVGTTAGAGPGTGGGTGAGAGTGVGNEKGPGSAGEPAKRKLPAQPPEEIMVGMDAPKDARPRRIVGVFAVDARGAARLVSVTRTSDGALNKRLREQLEEMASARWQPASLDGVAVADTVAYTVDLP